MKSQVKYSSIQVLQYSSISVFKYSSIQVFKYLSKEFTNWLVDYLLVNIVKSRDPIGSKKYGCIPSLLPWKLYFVAV